MPGKWVMELFSEVEITKDDLGSRKPAQVWLCCIWGEAVSRRWQMLVWSSERPAGSLFFFHENYLITPGFQSQKDFFVPISNLSLFLHAILLRCLIHLFFKSSFCSFCSVYSFTIFSEIQAWRAKMIMYIKVLWKAQNAHQMPVMKQVIIFGYYYYGCYDYESWHQNRKPYLSTSLGWLVFGRVGHPPWCCVLSSHGKYHFGTWWSCCSLDSQRFSGLE